MSFISFGIIVEATPDLVYDGTRLRRPRGSPNVVPKFLMLHDIKKILPDVKIIVAMRNPTDR